MIWIKCAVSGTGNHFYLSHFYWRQQAWAAFRSWTAMWARRCCMRALPSTVNFWRRRAAVWHCLRRLRWSRRWRRCFCFRVVWQSPIWQNSLWYCLWRKTVTKRCRRHMMPRASMPHWWPKLLSVYVHCLFLWLGCCQILWQSQLRRMGWCALAWVSSCGTSRSIYTFFHSKICRGHWFR